MPFNGPKRPILHTSPTEGKTPRISLSVHSDKVPRAHLTDWSNFFLSWRIGTLEMVEPFGWHELEQAKLAYLQSKLRQFEGMTISEVFNKAKKQNHAIPVNDICGEAQMRLKSIGHGDLDQVHRLRLSGKERVWGILRCNTLSLLWWDPNHLVYPYELPNT